MIYHLVSKFVFISCIFFFLQADLFAACTDQQRKQRIDEIGYELETIKKYFKIKDVEDKVDRIAGKFKDCEIPFSHFGFGRGILNYWKNSGYTAEFKKFKERAEYNSKFGPLSQDTLGNLKKYGDKLDTNLKFVKDLERRGIKSLEKEKSKCSHKDNRNDDLGAVRNQDSIGWCYAFGAADMLSHKMGKKISAIDLALAHNDNLLNDLRLYLSWGESDIEAGRAVTAIEKAQERGFCLEENLSSDDYSFSSLKNLLTKIESLKKEYDDESNIYPIDLCGKNIEHVKEVFRNLNVSDVSAVLAKSTNVTFIDMLSDRACGQRIKNTKYELTSRYGSTESGRKELFDEVDSVLNNDELVGITYDAYILNNIDHDDDPGWHYSTIVGRKFNEETKSCDYLVRNSWGRSCSSYDSRLKCEEGNIWVPKRVLAKKMRQIDYFK
jgi:hypothetical protein